MKAKITFVILQSVSSKSYVNAISKVYSGGNDLNLVAFTEGRIVNIILFLYLSKFWRKQKQFRF